MSPTLGLDRAACYAIEYMTFTAQSAVSAPNLNNATIPASPTKVSQWADFIWYLPELSGLAAW